MYIHLSNWSLERVPFNKVFIIQWLIIHWASHAFLGAGLLFIYPIFLFFLVIDFCWFCVVIRFFHPRHNGQHPPTSKDFLNSWERASIFPFECSVLYKVTTGTIFITSLVWRGPWLGIEHGTSRTRNQHSITVNFNVKLSTIKKQRWKSAYMYLTASHVTCISDFLLAGGVNIVSSRPGEAGLFLLPWLPDVNSCTGCRMFPLFVDSDIPVKSV